MPFEAKFLNLSTDNYQIKLLDPSTNQMKDIIDLSETENKKMKCPYEKLIIVIKNLSNPKEELLFELPQCELYTIDKDFFQQITIVKSDKQGKKFDGSIYFSPFTNNSIEDEKNKNLNSNLIKFDEKISTEKPNNTRNKYTKGNPQQNESKISPSIYYQPPIKNNQNYTNYKPSINQPASNYNENYNYMFSNGNPQHSYIASKDPKYIINADEENNLKKNNITFTNDIPNYPMIQAEKIFDLNSKDDNNNNYYILNTKSNNQDPISNFDKNNKTSIDNKNIQNTNMIYKDTTPSFYKYENSQNDFYTQNNINDNNKDISTENNLKSRSNVSPTFNYYARVNSDSDYLKTTNFNDEDDDYSKKDIIKENGHKIDNENTKIKEKYETNKPPSNIFKFENETVYSPRSTDAQLNVNNNFTKEKQISNIREIMIPEKQITIPNENMNLINEDKNTILNNNITNTTGTHIYDTFDVNKFLKELNLPIIPIKTTIPTNENISNINSNSEETSKKYIEEDKYEEFSFFTNKNIEEDKELNKNNLFAVIKEKDEIKNEKSVKDKAENKNIIDFNNEKDDNQNKFTNNNYVYQNEYENNLSSRNTFKEDTGVKQEEIGYYNNNLINPQTINKIDNDAISNSYYNNYNEIKKEEILKYPLSDRVSYYNDNTASVDKFEHGEDNKEIQNKEIDLNEFTKSITYLVEKCNNYMNDTNNCNVKTIRFSFDEDNNKDIKKLHKSEIINFSRVSSENPFDLNKNTNQANRSNIKNKNEISKYKLGNDDNKIKTNEITTMDIAKDTEDNYINYTPSDNIHTLDKNYFNSFNYDYLGNNNNVKTNEIISVHNPIEINNKNINYIPFNDFYTSNKNCFNDFNNDYSGNYNNNITISEIASINNPIEANNKNINFTPSDNFYTSNKNSFNEFNNNKIEETYSSKSHDVKDHIGNNYKNNLNSNNNNLEKIKIYKANEDYHIPKSIIDFNLDEYMSKIINDFQVSKIPTTDKEDNEKADVKIKEKKKDSINPPSIIEIKEEQIKNKNNNNFLNNNYNILNSFSKNNKDEDLSNFENNKNNFETNNLNLPIEIVALSENYDTHHKANYDSENVSTKEIIETLSFKNKDNNDNKSIIKEKPEIKQTNQVNIPSNNYIKSKINEFCVQKVISEEITVFDQNHNKENKYKNKEEVVIEEMVQVSNINKYEIVNEKEKNYFAENKQKNDDCTDKNKEQTLVLEGNKIQKNDNLVENNHVSEYDKYEIVQDSIATDANNNNSIDNPYLKNPNLRTDSIEIYSEFDSFTLKRKNSTGSTKEKDLNQNKNDSIKITITDNANSKKKLVGVQEKNIIEIGIKNQNKTRELSYEKVNENSILNLSYEKLNDYYNSMYTNNGALSIVYKNNHLGNSTYEIFNKKKQKDISIRNNSEQVLFIRITSENKTQEEFKILDPKKKNQLYSPKWENPQNASE